MKNMYMKKIMIFALAAAMIFAIAGCGKKDEEPRTFIDARDDGSIVANFDKTEKGTLGGSGITIGEGEYLVIETALTEGKVHVTVVRGGSDKDTSPVEESDTPATIDYVFEGSGVTEYMEIKPADYMFTVSVEEKASGTITASIKSLADDSAAAGETAAK